MTFVFHSTNLILYVRNDFVQTVTIVELHFSYSYCHNYLKVLTEF